MGLRASTNDTTQSKQFHTASGVHMLNKDDNSQAAKNSKDNIVGFGKRGRKKNNSNPPTNTTNNTSEGSNDSKKIKQGVIEDDVFNYLMRKDNSYLYMPQYVTTKLPHKSFNIWIEEDADGNRTPVEVTGSKGALTCRIVSQSYLVSKIDECLSIFGDNSHPHSIYRLTYKQCQQIALKIVGRGRTLKDKPLPMGFKSQIGLFRERKDYDCVLGSMHDKFPNIKRLFLDRMNNPETFCQSIGSLTDPNADCSQALFMHGIGGGGKTFLLNFIRKLAGNGCTSIDGDTGKGNFGLQNLIGKRVGVGDEIDSKWLTRNTFKQVTGGSPVLVHRKGLTSLSIEMRMKLFLVSNFAPEFSGDRAIVRRLLVIKMAGVNPKDRMTEKEIDALIGPEIPFFEGYCKDSYDALAGGQIAMTDASGIEDAIRDYELQFKAIFDDHFIFDTSCYGTRSKVTALEFARAWNLIASRDPRCLKRKFEKDFRNYIQKVTGREGESWSTQVRVDNKNIRYIEGIRFKG